MKIRSYFSLNGRSQRGFALISTLMLMALLVLIAVGLLSLSSISIRTTGHSADLAAARANARMALMLAVGQLQKVAGDDRRITVAGDQLGDVEGNPAAAAQRRHWTGVYNSWPAADPLAARPSPSFQQWLVSGETSMLESANAVTTAGTSGAEIQLVGKGTAGAGTDAAVFVPSISLGGGRGRIAWWTGDQGVKAMLGLSADRRPEQMPSLHEQIQASARNGVVMAQTSAGRPFSQLAMDGGKVDFLSSWPQAGHLTVDPGAPNALFHDLAMCSSGLLTNVRSGGFRKDLSMELERANPANAPKAPLYQVEGRMKSKTGGADEIYLEDGINLEELWAYYNLYKGLKPSSENFTTGGSISGAPALKMEDTFAGYRNDPFQYFKTPFVIHYQMIFSFFTRDVTVTRNGVPVPGRRLYLSVDPIVTLWNPLDVPLAIPKAIGLNVKFNNYPYDLIIRRSNPSTDPAESRCPLVATFTPETIYSPGPASYQNSVDILALDIGRGQDILVMRPGEVVQVSQAGAESVTKEGLDTNRTTIEARAGFAFGGGVVCPVKNEKGETIDFTDPGGFTVEARPNGLTNGKRWGTGMSLSGKDINTQHFGLNFTEYDIGLADGANSTGIGGVTIDWYYGNRRMKRDETRSPPTALTPRGTKPPADRLYANVHPDFFPTLPPDATIPSRLPEKRPFMMISSAAKTEDSTGSRTKWLQRLNPRAFHTDFYDLSLEERSRLPFEYRVQPMNSWISPILVASTNGQAYFGGGLGAEKGSPFVTTHSVAQEPIISLGALQHSFANGFVAQKVASAGHMIASSRNPMQPQISHAIGNSHAPSVLPMDKSTGMLLPSGLPLADHSYLANKGLWDDWFFSGIAPQTAPGFATKRSQKAVALDFFANRVLLPTARYSPNLGSIDATSLVNALIPTDEPVAAASDLVAAHIRVAGLFNVNSTSVQAWKVVLAGLNGVKIATRDSNGQQAASTTTGVPVAGLFAPTDELIDANGALPANDPHQYSGRRELSEPELESLAQELVKQVRKRGPFISLADFVNRRVGTVPEFARAGPLQCAIESSGINKAFTKGDRRFASGATVTSFAFPEAEEGPLSQGISGTIDQADLLTPIAPILSARSDSFVVRAYGDRRDSSGNVLARACCEAVVERDNSYLVGVDKEEVLPNNLTHPVNREFGRNFKIISFRWLSANDV